MSWHINATGTKAAVVAVIRRAKTWGGTDPASLANQAQMDAVKPLLISEVEAMPDSLRGHKAEEGYAAGVKLEASGHSDGSGDRNLSIKIESAILSLTEGTAAPA